ncbi:hypothetical protein [Glutamicibacter uratoxydans]|uniref:hypothetical protein n=1 Tax=Glutamicibacter uratoxydans TaxID=43667 RepID=UPI003D6E5311
MTQVQPMTRGTDAEKVSVPYVELSAEQWQQVPRTLPGWLLMLGSWLPLAGLLCYIFVIRDVEPLYENTGVWSLIVGTVTLTIAGLAAGRLAPWCGVLISGALIYATGGIATQSFPVLAGALGYFLLLGCIGNLSGARFCVLLRRWRRNATGQLQIPKTELERTSARSEVASFLPKLVGAGLTLGLFKVGINFFGPAERQWDRIDREPLETVIFSCVGLALWALLVLFRVLVRRFVGHMVLRVPVFCADGSAIRFGALSGVILREEAQSEDCACELDSEQSSVEEDQYFNSFVKVNDRCPKHGIDAVNAMTPDTVVRLATQPWVFGDHVHEAMIPSNTTIPLIGLSGWGSRPVRLLEQEGAHGTAIHAAPMRQIYPYKVNEVFQRSARSIRFRGVSNEALDTKVWDPADPAGEVIDRIPLHLQGIAGSLVRVHGQRPYLALDPH